MVVMLDFSTLSGTNLHILPPKRYGEHPCHFHMGVLLRGINYQLTFNAIVYNLNPYIHTKVSARKVNAIVGIMRHVKVAIHFAVTPSHKNACQAVFLILGRLT